MNNQLTVPPAYDDSHAYFPIEYDRLVAYDLASGTERWLVGSRPVAQPSAGDGLVFVPEEGAVVALHANDGSPAWRVPVDSTPVVQATPDNGWLIVPLRSGVILALRASDGHLIWQRDLGSPAHAPPTLADDRVYVAVDNGQIMALQITDGSPAWQRRVGGAANALLASGDRLFLGSTDRFFYCLMARDGRIDWRWRTGGDIPGMPVVDDKRVYFVSLDNVLRSLDRVSGGQHWMRPLPLRPTAGPVLAGGTVVVGGLAPALRTFNATDGTPAPNIDVGDEVIVPLRPLRDPVTDLPMLLVLTRDLIKGATATLLMRTIEPEAVPIAPLPGVATPRLTLPTRP